jgi:hypothetical protein
VGPLGMSGAGPWVSLTATVSVLSAAGSSFVWRMGLILCLVKKAEVQVHPSVHTVSDCALWPVTSSRTGPTRRASHVQSHSSLRQARKLFCSYVLFLSVSLSSPRDL